jgi:hypothetical protein
MQLILNGYPSVMSICGKTPKRIRLIELVARSEWMPHVINWYDGRREGYAWEPLKEVMLESKLVKPMQPAKKWATGAWTKRKEVLAIPRFESNPTLEVLAQSNQHHNSTTVAVTNCPAPFEDEANLALPHLAYGGGHVVTEPWTLCSGPITSYNALPLQNQALPPAATNNSAGDSSSSSSTSHGASSSFVLPRLDFFYSSPFALPVWDMRSATEGASMMSTFEQGSIFALPTSTSAHVWNPMKAEELVDACEDKDEPEEHLDGDEDDFFGDKEDGYDKEDSARMRISRAAINSMATHGGRYFAATTSSISTSPIFDATSRGFEHRAGTSRKRVREENCAGEPVRNVKYLRLMS